MRLAKLVVGACATVALVAAGFDADAKGGRGGGGRSGGGKSGGHHSHHSHHTAASGGSGYHHGRGYGHTTFLVSSFVVWPSAYYWPGYNPAVVPVVEYWYYCQPYAAYYPYVQECPTEWQLVLPSAPSPDDQ